MLYQQRQYCSVCKQETLHLYHNSTNIVGMGEWKCRRCEQREAIDEGIADLAKRLDERKEGEGQ